MQPHRSSALGYASAASAAHSRVYGACAAEAAASETSGLSVGGCIRARGYFGPHRRTLPPKAVPPSLSFITRVAPHCVNTLRILHAAHEH